MRDVDNSMLRLIAEVVAAETGRRPPRLARATEAATIAGWDSLTHARIVMALEDRLAVRIDIARTYELPDIGALADYLGSLTPHGP